MNPFFTIIIPTLNVATHISACLDSIVAQTFSNYEVFIQDGGSTDGTQIICTKFCQEGPMYFVSEKDLGVYDAMNNGIKKATGKWLYFLGADDVLFDPQVLQDVSNTLQNKVTDLLYGDVILKNKAHRYRGECSLETLLFESNLCHQSIFYSREIFSKVGLYNLRYPIWADWEFNIRCFRDVDLKATWFNRIIALYNDQSGISKMEDPILRKELPVSLLYSFEQERSDLKKTFAYRWGQRLFGWIDKMQLEKKER